jgi:uncharacterized protein with ParB-like and HNH nuclease domain/predicted transport protein
MQVYTYSFYNLLSSPCQFRIPLFQRKYSWKKEHCERLWEDIVFIHEKGQENHFIGSIVRISEPSPAGLSVSTLIDGQQRLTSLSLLITALRDYAIGHPGCGLNPEEIADLLLINKYQEGESRFKLLLTQSDRGQLIRLIEGSPFPDDTKSRIQDNFKYFVGKIDAKIDVGEINAVDLYQAVIKLHIVDIQLDHHHDDPQEIFESLNSTGLNLKDSDLVRNYLLMGLESSIQSDIYMKLWLPMERLFDYEHQSEHLDSFLRDYLTMKLGRIPRIGDVYKEFKLFRADCGQEPREVCEDICRYARHYSDMRFARSKDPELKSLYEDMRDIRMEVAYPFLLKAHGDCEAGTISKDVLREIVRLCVSYVLRRAVCDIPTNSLNKTFATFKMHVNQDDYLNSVKAFFMLQETYKEFPDDERFLSTFKSRDIYNMSRCRYILCRLEKTDNKSPVSLDKLTIEHVIPQNQKLSPEWQAELGDGWREIQKKYLHTVGNLTLTAYNAEMGDSSFAEKLDMKGGFKETQLRLNRSLVRETAWGEAQILNRAAGLAESARKAWPYPRLSESEIAPYLEAKDASRKYALEDFQHFNPVSAKLFASLDVRIRNLGTSVKREYTKHYASYKAEGVFANVILFAKSLKLFVNMKYSDVVDPTGISENYTQLGHWGSGDVRVTMDSLEKLDDVMAIVEQAFRMQETE